MKTTTEKETREMPTRYVRLTGAIKDMRIGEMKFFNVDALKIDMNRNGWLNPLAKPVDANGFREPVLEILCEEAGFRVNLDNVRDHMWETGPKPDRKELEGHEWLAVNLFDSWSSKM